MIVRQIKQYSYSVLSSQRHPTPDAYAVSLTLSLKKHAPSAGGPKLVFQATICTYLSVLCLEVFYPGCPSETETEIHLRFMASMALRFLSSFSRFSPSS